MKSGKTFTTQTSGKTSISANNIIVRAISVISTTSANYIEIGDGNNIVKWKMTVPATASDGDKTVSVVFGGKNGIFVKGTAGVWNDIDFGVVYILYDELD